VIPLVRHKASSHVAAGALTLKLRLSSVASSSPPPLSPSPSLAGAAGAARRHEPGLRHQQATPTLAQLHGVLERATSPGMPPSATRPSPGSRDSVSQRWAAEAAAAAHPTGVPRSLSAAMERIDEDGPALLVLGRGERRGPAGAHPLRVGAEGGRGRCGGAPVGRAAELERDRGADRQGRAQRKRTRWR